MTWPYWLANSTGLKLVNLARASQGNGIISRKLIHEISSRLDDRDAQDILVAVMWSGPDRHDFYHDQARTMVDANRKADLQWFQNPAHISETDAGSSGWVICNAHWQDDINQMYYRYFHDPVGSLVYTIEHVLRTQWFLQQNNIDYFMTTYDDSVFPDGLIQHPEVSYLFQQIDFQKFLPISGLARWCHDATNISLRKNSQHPTGDHHQRFVDDIVVPYLNQRGLLC